MWQGIARVLQGIPATCFVGTGSLYRGQKNNTWIKLRFISKLKTAYTQHRIRALPPEGATRCTILYLVLFETIQHQKQCGCHIKQRLSKQHMAGYKHKQTASCLRQQAACRKGIQNRTVPVFRIPLIQNQTANTTSGGQYRINQKQIHRKAPVICKALKKKPRMYFRP